MKACYIYNHYFERIDNYKNSGFCVATCANIGFEYCIFVIDNYYTYAVSLNPNDPIEDVIIPDNHQKRYKSILKNLEDMIAF